MTSSYDPFALHDRDLADFGHARARDIAFDAVHKLWERRRAEGMTQADLAEKIGRDPAWISRNLRAPGNWTLRTLGELVVALDGCLGVRATAMEDARDGCRDADTYQDIEAPSMESKARTEGGEFPPIFHVTCVPVRADTTQDQPAILSWPKPLGWFAALRSADTVQSYEGQHFDMLSDEASTLHKFMPEVTHAYR